MVIIRWLVGTDYGQTLVNDDWMNQTGEPNQGFFVSLGLQTCSRRGATKVHRGTLT